MISRNARGGTDEICATWEKAASMMAAASMSRISVIAGGSRAARGTAIRTTKVVPWSASPEAVVER